MATREMQEMWLGAIDKAIFEAIVYVGVDHEELSEQCELAIENAVIERDEVD